MNLGLGPMDVKNFIHVPIGRPAPVSCARALRLHSKDGTQLYMARLPRELRAQVDAYLCALPWHRFGALVPQPFAATPSPLRSAVNDVAVKADGEFVVIAKESYNRSLEIIHCGTETRPQSRVPIAGHFCEFVDRSPADPAILMRHGDTYGPLWISLSLVALTGTELQRWVAGPVSGGYSWRSVDTSHGWVRVGAELFHVNRPLVKFPFGSSDLYAIAAHQIGWRVVGDRDQERLLVACKAMVVLYDLRTGAQLRGVAAEQSLVFSFPRAGATLQVVKASAGSGYQWGILPIAANAPPALPQFYLSCMQFYMPRATERYVCVVTVDQRVQLLDPENLDRGFVPIDFGDWRHCLHNGSMLMLKRGKDSALFWHVDRRVGVRCNLSPWVVDSLQDCDGTVFITTSSMEGEARVFTTYLLPFPDMVDDEAYGCHYPNPALDSLPVVNARPLHRSTVGLCAARRSHGDGNAPPYFVDTGGRLWRLAPEKADTEQP